jgi:hypothetical protein
MRTWLGTVLIICALLIPQQSITAQIDQPQAEQPRPEPTKFSARVQVKISAPESIKNAIANIISNELRALGDVAVSNTSPNYRLTIMVIPNRTRQENFGFTFSTLITRPLDIGLLGPLYFSSKLDDKEKGLLLFLANKYERIEKQSMLTSSPEDTVKTCHEIVKGFDTDLLQKDRKLWQMLWDPQAKKPGNTILERPPD